MLTKRGPRSLRVRGSTGNGDGPLRRAAHRRTRAWRIGEIHRSRVLKPASRRSRGIALTLGLGTAVAVVLPVILGSAVASASGGPPTWTMDQGMANLGGVQAGAVSCASSTYCVAIDPTRVDKNSSFVWDGATWTHVGVVDPGGATLQLNGISCTSNTFCMAGGYLGNGSDPTGIIEKWDGSVWSVVANPESSASNAQIESLSCSAQSACVAVGEDSKGAFAESWNGAVWSSDVSFPGYSLAGVSCTNSASCVAVGSGPGNVLDSMVLVGTTWTPEAAVVAGWDDFLYAVSCASSTYCVAVGSMSPEGIGWSSTLIEVWDGSSWSIVASPNIASGTDGPGQLGGGILSAVSCTSPEACVAVGYGSGGIDPNGLSYPTLVVVETWDGSNWSLTPTPSPVEPDGGGQAMLSSISCVPNAANQFCMTGGLQYPVISATSALIMESSSAIGSLDTTTTDLENVGGGTVIATVNANATESNSRISGARGASVDAADLAAANGSAVPTGSVTVLNGDAPIADCPPAELSSSDEVSCAVGGLSGPFTAVYSGDGTFDGSADGPGSATPPTTTTTEPSPTTTTTLPPSPGATTTTEPSPTTTTTLPPSSGATTATVGSAGDTVLPQTSTVSPQNSTKYLRPALHAIVSATEKSNDLTTAVSTNQPGTVEVVGTYVAKIEITLHHRRTMRTVARPYGSARTVLHADKGRLTIHPNGVALAALGQSRALDITVTVRFIADTGSATTETRGVDVRFAASRTV
jgi:hypothetical protein